MGKQSRRESRRRRHETVRPESGLRTTIAVAPQMAADDLGRVTLDNELRLTRSALLYADQVDLVAPAVSFLWDFASLVDVDESNMLRRLAQLSPTVIQRLGVEAADIGNFKKAMRKAARQRPDGSLRRQFDAQWLPYLDEVRSHAQGALSPQDAEAIQLAKSRGALNVVGEQFVLEGDTDEQVAWFVERIEKGLHDPASALLLDPFTTQTLREDGTLMFAEPAMDARAKKATTGTGFIERLPAFPDASMESVLEARDELADARGTYRATVGRFSARLTSDALDASLPHEIDEMWMDEVRPAVDTLRSTAVATRAANETGKALLSEHATPAKITLAISALGDLTNHIPTTGAIALGGAGLATEAIRQTFKARSAKRNHELVYLADLGKRLGG